MADKKSELKEIKKDGGKAQKNSGRGQYEKGDATLGPYILYDIKEYEKSFSLSKKVWAKICTDAFKSGRKIPALKIVLGDTDKTRLWVISDAMFIEMFSAWSSEMENLGG